MVYLTYLMFLLFFMIFPAFLLSCLSAFLLFYFLTGLLRCAFASVCLCFCVCLSLLCCACAFGFSLSLGVAYRAYSRLLRSCSVFSLPARRRPASLRLVDGFAVDTPPGLLDNKSSASRLVHGEKVQPSSSRSERNYP